MRSAAILTVAVLALAACASAQFISVKSASVWLTPTQGNVAQGTIRLDVVSEQLTRITANITGLAANSVHGFHIHELGALDAQGLASGGHYNPFNVTHACPGTGAAVRHVGDLGNIKADANGNAVYDEVNELVKLNGITSVIGRAFILHLNPDDCVTQPVGNAGSRIAQGVIGILIEN
ncbi:copper/zinc superoxide dismutase [Capsaspora owczarzaki ATCC 30864]|uniref:Copper/zinc superoxide dismutase n=1 Tax=Capsaspora owczarzaki (strain ATCC 30864) TaxID=595528 RepID=A0A0D2VZA5_CAPO3|nr:copper/zinc superoxide dismutase [Capsaspora owczarzaki ATCC 30864]KJE97122.1 copper/zinc superoxide dismutase [Capsaspora owczarzaki ATCC 30864]|eukprot:XP_004343463.1 copper/zinc superoxide dismutase [Capsaspora owczarzaki ATCC 30864]